MTFRYHILTPWKSFSGRSLRQNNERFRQQARNLISLVLIAKSAAVSIESFDFIKRELVSNTDIFCQAIMLHELGRIIVEGKLSKICKSALLLFEELMQSDLPKLWPLKFNNIIKKMIASENDIVYRRGNKESRQN